jgi:tetratricopeptide (TPR) repeat protein
LDRPSLVRKKNPCYVKRFWVIKIEGASFMTNPQRNDPCPCGSGLKYKKCCLKKDLHAATTDDEAGRLRVEAFKQMGMENWNDAIQLFKSCLPTYPEPYEILNAIGACYDGAEDYLLATEYYEKALAVCPKASQADVNYRIGVSAASAERMEKAARAFQRYLELQKDPRVREQIEQILQVLREIEQGLRSPVFFRVMVQLQRAFSDMEAERYSSAAERLEALSKIDPENSAIFYNLGVVYTFLKREDEALAQFRRAVDLDPQYAQAWYNMGQIHLWKDRDASRALNCFERAASIRPDYVGAHHQRGVALEMLGDRERALACWRTTLELDPENRMAKDNIDRLEASPSS